MCQRCCPWHSDPRLRVSQELHTAWRWVLRCSSLSPEKCTPQLYHVRHTPLVLAQRCSQLARDSRIPPTELVRHNFRLMSARCTPPHEPEELARYDSRLKLKKCIPRQGPAQHALLELEMTLVASKRSVAAVLLRCLLYSTVQYLASLVVAKKSAIAVILSYLQLAS